MNVPPLIVKVLEKFIVPVAAVSVPELKVKTTKFAGLYVEKSSVAPAIVKPP